MSDIHDYNRKKKNFKSLVQTCLMRIETVCVGDINRFEQWFGFLWGHGKPYKECSVEEKEWRRFWSECRDSIFDHAALQKELLLNQIQRGQDEQKEVHSKRRPRK